jgi:hypothetical protein
LNDNTGWRERFDASHLYYTETARRSSSRVKVIL